MRLTGNLVVFVVVLTATSSSVLRAATFNATINAQNYTIVEVDPFNSGQEPGGNTQRASGAGTFWSSNAAVNDDGFWNLRTYTPFNTGYVSLPGATDRVFEASYLNNPGGDDLANAATLRLDVSGLPTGNTYNVFLLYTTREDGQGDALTRAVLNDGIVNGSLFGPGDAIGYVNANSPVFKTAIAPLGSTAANATSFFVEIAPELTAERSHALAIAYQAVPIPEPSTVVLASFGLVGCLRLARRRK